MEAVCKYLQGIRLFTKEGMVEVFYFTVSPSEMFDALQCSYIPWLKMKIR